MSAVTWALLTAAIWGIVPLLEKWGIGSGSPTVAVFVRSLGVMAGTVVFGLLWQPWQAMGGMGGKSITLLMTSGFLASFVGQMVFYRALQHGALSQVTPLAGIYPLVAAILGWVLLREPFTLPRALGVAFIIAGVALLRR